MSSSTKTKNFDESDSKDLKFNYSPTCMPVNSTSKNENQYLSIKSELSIKSDNKSVDGIVKPQSKDQNFYNHVSVKEKIAYFSKKTAQENNFNNQSKSKYRNSINNLTYQNSAQKAIDKNKHFSNNSSLFINNILENKILNQMHGINCDNYRSIYNMKNFDRNIVSKDVQKNSLGINQSKIYKETCNLKNSFQPKDNKNSNFIENFKIIF